MKKFKIESNELLLRNQLKNIYGGDFNCTCNGHNIGTAPSAGQCAANCASCVGEGGCVAGHEL